MAKDLTLNGLQDLVKSNQARFRERQKAKYDLAKSLGFSSAEAVILQNQAEETIRRLATERETQNQDNC